MVPPLTFVEVLNSRAKDAPERIAFSFEGAGRQRFLTYGAMQKRAWIQATSLLRADLFQKRTLLLFSPGLEYILAFFACLCAGAIAVPTYTPRPHKRKDRNLLRILSILGDAQPKAAMTTRQIFSSLEPLLEEIPELNRLHWIITDEAADAGVPCGPDLSQAPVITSDHLAFLQYTSGSTSSPKGVMIDHANLMANERMIRSALGNNSHSVGVGWLPLFHDMGLIGNVLQPVFVGFPCHLMAPESFLQRPARWFEMISRHRATGSGGPNFAFELCSRRVTPEQIQNLDLRCWKVAFCGSEPVREVTLENFARKFSTSGFQRKAFLPCYGLAEATLLVSGGPWNRGPIYRNTSFHSLLRNKISPRGVPIDDGDVKRSLVGCGKVAVGQSLAIVNPQNRKPLPPEEIGEIWVSGPNIAKGYWNRVAETQEIFNAYLETGEGPFMRTGDTGFCEAGNLFITGRLKEIMIIRGRNHYPQDIELTAQNSHAALRGDGCAAFAIEQEGESRVCLLAEVERTRIRNLQPREVFDAVRTAVASHHGLQIHKLVLLKPMGLPKTTSGKIRRQACRERYLSDTLPMLEKGSGFQKEEGPRAIIHLDRNHLQGLPETARAEFIEIYLRSYLAHLRKTTIAGIPSDRAVLAQGIDSLEAVALQARVTEILGLDFELEKILSGGTVAEIARDMARQFTHRPIKAESLPPSKPLDGAPLSYNQRALWFLYTLEPQSRAYQIPVALRLFTELDRKAFSKAFRRLGERHPILRCTFENRDGRPAHALQEDRRLPIRWVDATSWDAARLNRRLNEAAATKMDLGKGPVVRAEIYRRSPNEHVLLLVAHHIVVDLRSLFLLFQELESIYGVEVSRTGTPPAKPKRNYADFITWQARRIEGEAGARFWKHWSRDLAGPSPVLMLPLDHDRPKAQTYNGAAVDFHIDAPTLRRLRVMSRDLGATLFATLLAAYQAFLCRYTGQTDIWIGTPTAGRYHPDFKNVVGDFANTLVFRADLSGNPRFHHYLCEVMGKVSANLSRGEYPLQLLVERLSPTRDLRVSPLFQTMFSMQQTPDLQDALPLVLGKPGAKFQLGAWDLRAFPLEVTTSQVDLALTVVETENGLEGRFVYNSDLFMADTVRGWVRHFSRFLEAIGTEPRQRIAGIPLLATREVKNILAMGEGPHTENLQTAYLQHIFENRARRHPDRDALATSGIGGRPRLLTYGTLNQRANVLAQGLRPLSVGPETLVALCLNRTPDLVACALAVLKTGGAYLPLDPGHPPERLAFILEESGADLLLTAGTALETKSRIVQLADLEKREPEPTHLPSTRTPVSSANTAYVIFTSGSTGKPKGVAVSHAALVNLVLSMSHEPGLSPSDKFLAVTTFAFDIAALEWFVPLVCGARLVLASSEESLAADRLAVIIHQHGITAMQATPATWQMLLATDWEGVPKVLCGGEALPGPLAARLDQKSHSLWNLYGPTETTIWSSVRQVQPAGHAVEPIGRPIENTRFRVLDAAYELAPPGVTGGLYIGGMGLARGYWRRPELTAPRFLPDPFSKIPGSRLYETGDLVQMLPGAAMAFLGRGDDQIKLRGFRIEIGEIEKVLAQKEDVARTVVILREDRPGDQRLAAYLLPANPQEKPKTRDLRNFLSDKLPDYMIPADFVILDELPLNPNGKIDRKALPTPFSKIDHDMSEPPGSKLESQLADIWRDLLHRDHVGREDNFFELGGHSLLLAELKARLEQRWGRKLPMVTLFQFPTIRSLAEHLANSEGEPLPGQGGKKIHTVALSGPANIAIVGMACRFPGAANVDSFWNNLVNGVESIAFFPEEALLQKGISPDTLSDPRYVLAGSFLENVEDFDAGFFDYAPRDARLIDPQQRVFLEIAWEALESAGYNPDTYPGAIGVYAGSGMNTYLYHHLFSDRLLEREGGFQVMFSSDKDFLATRVSYKLNLSGPSVNVQTACSTSLVAVHQACQSLRLSECDMALAGGVTIRLPQKTGYLYQDGLILSPDGHCRAFDAKSAGTVAGNGAGVVLLKPLGQALADGDTIHAVIKGSALNNDASRKVGFTAPGVEGQKNVIRDALAQAGTPADSIGYVETHGTATKMGDPIEIAALTQAYRVETERKEFCAVGSVKTNLGHLDTAAGIAGLIKTTLALEHGKIPASLNFTEPNPQIDFSSSPFFVNRKTREWKTNGQPRRAGVSSFGIGGTNAHLILQEAPPVEASGPSRSMHLLVFSAKTGTALDQLGNKLADHLDKHPEHNIADVAATLQTGRKRFNHGRMLVCGDSSDAVTWLRNGDPKKIITRNGEALARQVVFMFPGQGAQHPRMAQEIYEAEPVFRGWIDRCSQELGPQLGQDLRKVLFPPENGDLSTAAPLMEQTAWTQPALFSVEYALAQLWISWGVKPSAMIGHSIGEYVAACLAGVFTLERALALVAARGRLIQSLPRGAMTAVSLEREKLTSLLGDSLDLAAYNPGCVVSGELADIEEFEKSLDRRGLVYRRLKTSHAFHSDMMDPVLKPFTRMVAAHSPKRPEIPFISNVTGSWITAEQATAPGYWARHLRGTVEFGQGLATLFEDSKRLLLEVGPGWTLSTMARRHPQKPADQMVFSSLHHPKDQESDRRHILTTLGKLWLGGVPIDWKGFQSGEKRKRLPLPTYPFERTRHWVEPHYGGKKGFQEGLRLTKNTHVDSWFYLPIWQRFQAPLPRKSADKVPGFLLFSDRTGLAEKLSGALRQTLGAEVITVKSGVSFTREAENSYSLDPGKEADYEQLFKMLRSKKNTFHHVLHLGCVTGVVAPEESSLRKLGFHGLLHLARSLGKLRFTDPLSLTVISDYMQDVTGLTPHHPEKATLLGPVKVIPLEYPQIRCRSVDVANWSSDPKLINRLVGELMVEDGEQEVAYHGRNRWVRNYIPAKADSSRKEIHPKKAGVYLITGGLGGIGLEVAKHLAGKAEIRLVLTSRESLPSREEWDAWLSGHGKWDRLSERIRAVKELEERGAEVLCAGVDVTDEKAMHDLVLQTRERFGSVHGIIHAAGVPGGGLIQQSSAKTSDSVIAPKVTGTQVLTKVFRNYPPDFLILFSSINTVLPRLGQVDYLAGNAFLDAFSDTNPLPGSKILSLNWDSWREVGMAADTLTAGSRGTLSSKPQSVTHPLFESVIPDGSGGCVLVSHLSVERHWMLHEHWIMGKAVLPGTAYLEMARAAYEHLTGSEPVCLKDVIFLRPLALDSNHSREMRTELKKLGSQYRFTIRSRVGKNSWQEHARGMLTGLEDAVPEVDLEELIRNQEETVPDPFDGENLSGFQIKRELLSTEKGNRIELVSITPSSSGGPDSSGTTISLGPRWQTARRFQLVGDQGLAWLTLPETATEDMTHYKLHPALLDMAAGFLRLMRNQADYLPLSYERLKFFKPLPQSVVSLVKSAGTTRGNPRYDVQILDESGKVLVAIHGFTLGRLDAAKWEAVSSGDSKGSERAEISRNWLSNREGLLVFDRALASNHSRLLISTVDLEARIKQGPAAESVSDQDQADTQHPRPELMTPYAAPRNDTEKTLTQIWQRVMGIDRVGVHDNFNELGGDSLLITRIHARVEKTFKMVFSVAELMQYPTVGELATFLEKTQKQTPEESRKTLTRLRERSGKQRQSMQRQKMLMQRSRVKRKTIEP